MKQIKIGGKISSPNDSRRRCVVSASGLTFEDVALSSSDSWYTNSSTYSKSGLTIDDPASSAFMKELSPACLNMFRFNILSMKKYALKVKTQE
jgi:hypothetical protein